MSPAFEFQRPLLQGLAYRMLGSVDEAEEVVAETLLRWHRREEEPADPALWLLEVCARVCIDALEGARDRRGMYVGPWLPEPLVGREGAALWGAFPRGEGEAPPVAPYLSLGILLSMERLRPVERAAFLLRDLLHTRYPDLARILGRSVGTSRNLVSGARRRLREADDLSAAPPALRDALLERFLRSSARATLEPVEALLGREVQLWGDGGGVVPAPLRIIEGPERVARFLLEMGARARPGTALVRGMVNADPALLVLERGRVSTTVTAVAGRDGRIARILMVRNPSKLARARLPGPGLRLHVSG